MDEKVNIVCSCIPGFESIALKECKTRLDVDAVSKIRGRITFEISIRQITHLVRLRSVHHYWVVVVELCNFFQDTCNLSKEGLFEKLLELPTTLDWKNALTTWKAFKIFLQENKHLSDSNKEGGELQLNNNGEAEKTEEISSLLYDEHLNPLDAGEKLSFRVTASRTGEHIFSSMDSAVHLGAGINDLFHWRVNLSKYDIEVVSFILDQSLSIGIQLTKDSQSMRNITHFGPTTLKANISYCLLELADITEGEIICDPMCGGGSISLEGSSSFPKAFHLCGDNHETAVQYAGDNFFSHCLHGANRNCTLPYSVIRWDVYHLPLRTGCVDGIVTDLPFGKKIGSRERNLFLYPIALDEMARVCRPLGSAVLLTQHKQAMWKALGRSHWWKLRDRRMINMGGMNVAVYILGRTKEEFKLIKTETTIQNLCETVR